MCNMVDHFESVAISLMLGHKCYNKHICEVSSQNIYYCLNDDNLNEEIIAFLI